MPEYDSELSEKLRNQVMKGRQMADKQQNGGLSIEDKAIAEAVAIQARARQQYNQLADALDGAKQRIAALEHEVDLKDRAVASLSKERDLLLNQVASFHTHVTTFYSHLRDLVSSIPGSPIPKMEGKAVADLKALEAQIISAGKAIKDQLVPPRALLPEGESAQDHAPIPQFLQQGPRATE